MMQERLAKFRLRIHAHRRVGYNVSG